MILGVLSLLYKMSNISLNCYAVLLLLLSNYFISSVSPTKVCVLKDISEQLKNTLSGTPNRIHSFDGCCNENQVCLYYSPCLSRTRGSKLEYKAFLTFPEVSVPIAFNSNGKYRYKDVGEIDLYQVAFDDKADNYLNITVLNKDGSARVLEYYTKKEQTDKCGLFERLSTGSRAEFVIQIILIFLLGAIVFYLYYFFNMRFITQYSRNLTAKQYAETKVIHALDEDTYARLEKEKLTLPPNISHSVEVIVDPANRGYSRSSSRFRVNNLNNIENNAISWTRGMSKINLNKVYTKISAKKDDSSHHKTV